MSKKSVRMAKQKAHDWEQSRAFQSVCFVYELPLRLRGFRALMAPIAELQFWNDGIHKLTNLQNTIRVVLSNEAVEQLRGP
jgi:hypothetical protein